MQVFVTVRATHISTTRQQRYWVVLWETFVALEALHRCDEGPRRNLRVRLGFDLSVDLQGPKGYSSPFGWTRA